MKRRLGALCVGIGVWVLLTTTVFCAPFVQKFTHKQPDGTAIELWGQGDEFHAVFETLDGYTVVYEPTARAYFYARLAPDGTKLLSTGRLVGKDGPAGLDLAKHLRITVEARRKQVKERREKWEREVGLSQRWNDLKAARRAAEAAASPDGATTAGDPVVMSPPTVTTVGTKVGMCLLVDFSDSPATIPQADIRNFLNSDSYTGYGNNGSVKKYFQDVSNNTLTYTNIVTVYVRVPNPKSYYDDPSKDCGDQGRLLINDAVAAMKALPNYNTEILPTFNALTVDSSNRVLALNVFYAGSCDSPWTFGLWPHAWVLSGTVELSPGGKKLYRYQMTNIGSSLTLGTFCHENGHMLCGFPDLYDYDYDSTGGAGIFCLMNSGGHGANPVQVCAYLKTAAGWATIVDINSNITMAASLSASGAEFNKFYRYRKPGVSTEYFLLENRQKAGRDANLPGGGIAIWHVDEFGDRDDQRMLTNSLHQNYECTLEQADGLWHFQNNANDGDANDLFYLGNPAALYTNRFEDGTTVSARWWDGTPSRARFYNFSASGATMTFRIGAEGWLILPNTVFATSANGGTFTPPCGEFEIHNISGTNLQWTGHSTQPWVDVMPGNDSMAKDKTNWVKVCVNEQALALPAGIHTSSLIFSNLNSGFTETRTVQLTIAPPTAAWINTADGLWQETANWSLGLPHTAFYAAVTNGASKTVLLDITTAGGFASSMTISNLVLSAPLGFTNTIHLRDIGAGVPLTVVNNCEIGSGGRLVATNSVLVVQGAGGGDLAVNGAIVLQPGSTLLASNAAVSTIIGSIGTGSLAVDGATVRLAELVLGRDNGATGTLDVNGSSSMTVQGRATVGSNGVGSVQISSGNVTVGDSVVIAAGSNGRGSVTVTGGELLMNNTASYLGHSGIGEFTITGGRVAAGTMYLGYNAGAIGTLTIAGGTNLFSGSIYVARNSSLGSGAVAVLDGALIATNAASYIGYDGAGQMAVANGHLQLHSLMIGNTATSRGTVTFTGGNSSCGSLTVAGSGAGNAVYAGGLHNAATLIIGANAGSRGSVTFQNGTNLLNRATTLGSSANSTGTLMIAGGLWVQTNDTTTVGQSGTGAITIAGGMAKLRKMIVADNRSGRGTFTMVAGQTVLAELVVGKIGGNTGAVWITGGELLMTNAIASIGAAGCGVVTVSNGQWHARSLQLGTSAGGNGSLKIAGGVVTVSSNVLLGTRSTGTVGITGGGLFVTNAAGNATLEITDGGLLVSGGILKVDRLVATNADSNVSVTGGEVQAKTAVLTANQDNDNDGLPNYWEQAHGINPLSATGANGADGDLDGDGVSNAKEYLAGTSPTDAGSAFRVTTVQPQGNDMLVTWTAVGGRRYVVQTNATPDNAGFTDLSPPISIPYIPGTGETVTNYLHIGGTANTPARFYRVRLLP